MKFFSFLSEIFYSNLNSRNLSLITHYSSLYLVDSGFCKSSDFDKIWSPNLLWLDKLVCFFLIPPLNSEYISELGFKLLKTAN